MKVTFQCAYCGQEITRDASLVPTAVECPHCQKTIEAPAVSVSSGTVIGGFRLEKPLGKGAMGQVYLATQLSMDRKVAVKVLRPDLVGDESHIKRFLHEVRMLARVEHPNVVMAFEAGEDQGLYYLAMSYVEGDNLEDRLAREGRIPEAEALSIVLQVARALAHVWNTHQMLHNDIKPGNIVMDSRGEVKILDMGLSKTALEETGLSMTGVTFGTPNYMSPEQAKGQRDLDFRSDQYALGTVLYHMVSGQLPYDAPSIGELITKKLMEPCLSPREINPDVSEACELVICVMMAYDPDSRYPSWEALIADIERILRGEPPLAKWVEEGIAAAQPDASAGAGPAPATRPRRRAFGPPQRRRRRRIAVAALAVLLGALAIAGWRTGALRLRAIPATPGTVLKNPAPVALSVVRFDAALHRGRWQAVVAEVRHLSVSLQDFESAGAPCFRDEGQSRPALAASPEPVHGGTHALAVSGGTVSIRPRATPLDVSGATHIGLWVYDTVGTRPLQLSLRDASGFERPVWSASYARKGSWTLITWPIAAFAPADFSRIERVKLTVAEPGKYYADDLLLSTESDIKVELKDGASIVRSANTVDGVLCDDGTYEIWVRTPEDLVVGWNYFYLAFLYPTGRSGDPWNIRLAVDGTDDQPWSKVTD